MSLWTTLKFKYIFARRISIEIYAEQAIKRIMCILNQFQLFRQILFTICCHPTTTTKSNFCVFWGFEILKHEFSYW